MEPRPKGISELLFQAGQAGLAVRRRHPELSDQQAAEMLGDLIASAKAVTIESPATAAKRIPTLTLRHK